MEIQETWGIPRARIEAFFRSQEGLRQDGDGVFSSDGCRIRLQTLPEERFGSFSLPRTRVCFSGEDADVEAIRRRFVLNFLSAGG